MFWSYIWTIFRLSINLYISYTNVWGIWVATQIYVLVHKEIQLHVSILHVDHLQVEY